MTKVATVFASGDTAQVELMTALTEQLDGAKPQLICIFASVAHPLGNLLEAASVRWPGAKVIGCSSAGEFSESAEGSEGISGFALSGDFVVQAGFADRLGAAPEAAVRRAAEPISAAIDGYPHRTGLLLLDPFSGQGEESTLLLTSLLEQDGSIRLVGGAAGDDLSMTSSVVGVGTGAGSTASEDALALVVIHSKKPFGIGVRHGHSALSGPLTVTRANANIVYELDGKPAWDVWREHTRAAAAVRGIDVDALDDDQVGGFLLTYEASLASGAALKVRAPLVRHEDGSLSFATGIPTGAVIRITQSDAAGQVQSARNAAEIARDQLRDNRAAGALVFDCICRKLILGDQFLGAVGSISAVLGDVPLAGFETYGEIALDSGDMSGFHNTTTVVLAVPA